VLVNWHNTIQHYFALLLGHRPDWI